MLYAGAVETDTSSNQNHCFELLRSYSETIIVEEPHRWIKRFKLLFTNLSSLVLPDPFCITMSNSISPAVVMEALRSAQMIQYVYNVEVVAAQSQLAHGTVL